MRCVGDIESERVEDAAPVVVLVDAVGGGELAAVARLLAPLGTPAVLLGPAELASGAFVLDASAGVFEFEGRVLRPVVAWIRHCGVGTLAARGDPLKAQAWSGFFKQIAGLAARTLPGAAPDGITQLSDAARHGFRVPRTTSATDVAAAARHLNALKLIIKTPDFRLFTADRDRWPALAPVVLDRDAALAHPRVDRPVVVQEYLAGARELRVYHLDQALCAFEVRAERPGQIWTDPEAVKVQWVRCPPEAEHAVRRVCTTWGLRYGAFDLLIHEDGSPSFLEVNPDGDWLWYERKAGRPGVSFLAAVMVREMYVRSGS